jgi:hypothetical protein
VRALRERDFSAIFAVAHGAGVYFNRIAEGCALKSERVSQIARGIGAPSRSRTSFVGISRIVGDACEARVDLPSLVRPAKGGSMREVSRRLRTFHWRRLISPTCSAIQASKAEAG